jgi:hypothetical protein
MQGKIKSVKKANYNLKILLPGRRKKQSVEKAK